MIQLTLAAQYRFPDRRVVTRVLATGGLISYRADFVDMNRQAAPYVDRVVRGDKTLRPSEQAPTKLEMIVNLKTAKALG